MRVQWKGLVRREGLFNIRLGKVLECKGLSHVKRDWPLAPFRRRFHFLKADRIGFAVQQSSDVSRNFMNDSLGCEVTFAF